MKEQERPAPTPAFQVSLVVQDILGDDSVVNNAVVKSGQEEEFELNGAVGDA